MAKLSEKDAETFHKLMGDILFYANSRLNIVKGCETKEKFFQTDVQETIPLRDKLFSQKSSLIDDYVLRNPDNLSQDELKIVSSWKNFKEGEFFLYKYTNEQTLFLSSKEQKVYGVLGIVSSFDEMFGKYTPVLVKMRLLPFRDKIIYEGILFPYNISFGGGMRSTIKVDADTAIQKYGIINSFDSPVVEKINSDEEMLRFYMKTQDNRDRYEDKISVLKSKSSSLNSVYYQELSKINAREIKKKLKDVGVKGYFAVVIDNVVSSALTEKELDKNLADVLPADKKDWIYKFKI